MEKSSVLSFEERGYILVSWLLLYFFIIEYNARYTGIYSMLVVRGTRIQALIPNPVRR
jgi:hypothetical protein